MMDDPLYRDPALAQFYDAANGWGADFDYCMALAAGAASVLDLGCGTGELAAALRPNRRVTGVDPAAAMLAIARQRPGGHDVTWVEADARSVRLGERFDLVLLTGHAFQVFLTSEDQRAALSTIAAHLASNGRFIFDSRNPAPRTWENRNRHNTLHRLEHPQLGTIEAWDEPSYDDDTNVLTYENGYRVLATGRTFSASAQIRYTPQEELAEMIEAAGLAVERWLGDWDGRPYHRTAREIIPIGRLARERPVMRTGRGTEELASAGPAQPGGVEVGRSGTAAAIATLLRVIAVPGLGSAHVPEASAFVI